MTVSIPTDTACQTWFAAIRAQHQSGDVPNLGTLARVGIVPLTGGRNNTVYLCNNGEQCCCIKLYRTDNRQRDEREWQALRLLAVQLPGLAPRPILHSPDERLPMVAMEYLPGDQLLHLRLTRYHLDVLAERLRLVYTITPASAEYPYHSTGAAVTLLARVEDWVSATTPPTRAILERWLAGDDPLRLRRSATPVFGVGDPNLANWLWGAGTLHRVDLEYAGWCDLANELADLVEGPWARILPETEWLAFAKRFTGLDWGRFTAARRLIAHFWLALFDTRNDKRLSQQLARAQELVEEG